MGEIELPAVQPGTKLLAALQTMQDDGTSGIVVNLPERPAVVHVRELLQVLRARGDVAVEEVPWRAGTLYLPTTSGSFPFLTDVATGRRLLDVLPAEKVLYAVIAFTADKAKVITAHETGTDAFAQKAILCRCETDNTHVFDPSELVTSGTCNYDPSKVNCS